jgi:hypothetical protein
VISGVVVVDAAGGGAVVTDVAGACAGGVVCVAGVVAVAGVVGVAAGGTVTIVMTGALVADDSPLEADAESSPPPPPAGEAALVGIGSGVVSGTAMAGTATPIVSVYVGSDALLVSALRGTGRRAYRFVTTGSVIVVALRPAVRATGAASAARFSVQEVGA